MNNFNDVSQNYVVFLVSKMPLQESGKGRSKDVNVEIDMIAT